MTGDERDDDRFGETPTLEHDPRNLHLAESAAFELSVEEGPDRGTRIVIDASRPGRVFVGQSPASDLVLTDPLASRRHAAFELAGPRVRLTDLASTNGTFLGALTVFDVSLGGGEAIRIGSTILKIRPFASNRPPSISTAAGFGRVVGASAALRRLYPLCEKLAAARVPLVIEGETGTGKEVLAESIHDMGPRKDGPFEVFDCTAVPANLLESALFGHERGAFTGATSQRRGVFEEANGGTLLIDEIGDLDIALQSKLLRVLERSEVRRVGGSGWIKVDVRVIAATRRDLDQAVQLGRFRDDLYFRVAVARIELPPLRKRREDIPMLMAHFWKQLGAAGEPSPELIAKFVERDWPGNVRELYNAVARTVALGDLGEFNDDGAGSPAEPEAAGPSAEDALERILALDLPLPHARARLVEEFERRYVTRVLERHDGNVARAAAASGLARRYFQLLKARRTS